jgi:hypothetical protein
MCGPECCEQFGTVSLNDGGRTPILPAWPRSVRRCPGAAQEEEEEVHDRAGLGFGGQGRVLLAPERRAISVRTRRLEDFSSV